MQFRKRSCGSVNLRIEIYRGGASLATSSQRDVNILTHCLNRHKESFETACDKILEHWLSIKRSARPSVGPDADLHSSNSSTMTSSPGSRRLEDEARTFLAQRLVSLLSSMILPNIPHTISAVDARLCGTLVELPERLLPSETELETARVMAEKNRKKGLHLPVDKIFSAVREFNGRFNYSVCIYIAAVAEKIITKWLDLAIRFEEKAQIENVIRASAFQNIFFICRDRVKAPKESAVRRISQFFPQDYDRCVDELINLVSSSVEQLNLILRIFREPLLPVIGDHQTATTVEVKVTAEADESDLSVAAEVFGGIVDFYHNFRFLLDCLETDSVEDYSSATGRTQATTTSPRGLNTTPTSPMRPPSAQSYFSSFSAFHSSWPAPEHRRTQQPFSASSSFSLSSVATGSSNFSTTVNCMNDGQSQCGGVCSRQSRLVGPLLSGPAEDICLGPFMQYLDTVLDLDCSSILWSLSDRSEVIEALGRLSRTVIHTVSKLKPTYVATTSTNNSVCPELGPDPSWLFLHSFLCPVCRLLEQPGAPKSPTGSSDWNLINDQNPGQRQEPGTSSLQIPRPACNFLVNCFRYLLPRLVLLPIFQFYCLCGIVWALRENTQDQDDKDFLTDFRGMLTKIRVRLESDLSRRTGLHLQLARLISTGHVASVPRSINVPPPLPASSLRVRSSSTSPLLGTLTTVQSRATSNTTSADCTATPLLGGTCLLDISHIFRAACATVVGEGSLLAMSPTTTTSATTSDNRETQTGTASSLLGGAVLAMGLAKVEEIERLTGGKERLAGSLALGNFVMEGRLLVREESMKNASERHVYLFTNCMLVCKRTEKRSALAPSSAPPALRIKRRLPLDLIHVIDCTNPIPPSPQAYTFCDAPPESGYYSSSDSSHQNLSRTQGGLSWASSSRSSSTAHLNPAAEHNSFSVEFVEVRHVPSSSTPSAAQTLSAGANAVASTLEPGAATSPSGGFSDTGGCSLTPGSTLTGPVEAAAVEPSLPPGANIQRIWFEASNPEEKADWMASLISIQTSRIFDLYLRTLPKLEIPLRLPTPDKYKFTRPDTPNVIVFEHPSLTPSVRSPNPGSSQPSCTDDLLEDDFADLGLTDEEDMFALPDELLQETEQLAPSGSSISDETASTVTDTSLSPTPLPAAAAAATARAPTPLSASTGTTVALSPSYSASRPAIPQIRFATVEKLVERLTYPTYFDAAGVNAFLLSYRRYLTPDQLLTLLIERFNVPDPTFEPQEFEVDRLRGKLESPAGHMLRRFRSGYKFRVQSRVMMFLSRWVRSPRLFEIDFAPNHELCARLTEFLSEVTTCHLLHTARAIEQWISHADIPPYPYVDVSPSVSGETLRPPDEPGRLSTGGHLHESPVNSSPASPISLVPRLGALFEGPDHIDLLQIHPTELAEQVTLHEWDLYRRINFLEVVSGEDTPEKAPNLHACKDFSNKFHRWLVYSILSERNAEDRTLAIQRVLDLMLIFEHFQNQQGFQEAKASLVSSGVFRLKKSFQVRWFPTFCSFYLHTAASIFYDMPS
nr:unnamed protein product [Spirometra erinaceieuropaei]